MSGGAGAEAVPCRGHCAHHADQLDFVLRRERRHLLPGVPGFHSLHSQHVWPRSPGEFSIISPCSLPCASIAGLAGLPTNVVLVFG